MDISNDGTILAVGDYRFRQDTGLVKLYQEIGDEWNQVGQDLIGETFGDDFGDSLSLSENGTFVAISASSHNSEDGYAKVFHLSDGNWDQAGNIMQGGGGIVDLDFLCQYPPTQLA